MMENFTPIDEVELNGFHKLLSIRSGGGWIMDGYVLSIIGVGMVQFSNALHLNGFWEGMIASATLIGLFFGGFMGGGLTDLLGRQKLYFLGPMLFFFCSAAQYWANSGAEIFILRFMIGIGVGIEYPVAGSLLVEFMPKKYRGPRLARLTVLWFVGGALAYIFGTILLKYGGKEAWRLVLASPAVIGLFLLVVRIGTPESPRWLISKGRDEEADIIIKKIYGPSFGLKNFSNETRGKRVKLANLLQSGYGKRMFFVAVFWSCAVIPLFAVYSFAPQVLAALNLVGSWEAYGSVAITLFFVVGCVIATYLVDVIGRRPLVIHSFLWSGLLLLILGVFSRSSPALILSLFGAYAIFIGGAQVLQLVYPNELFPTDIRALAVGMSASLSRIGAAIGTWLVPLSLQNLGICTTMYIAAFVSFVGFFVSLLLAPETLNLNLHEASSLEGRGMPERSVAVVADISSFVRKSK